MKIRYTGRHFDISDDLTKYVEKKFSKLEKYFSRLIDIQITMYIEKHMHIVEAVINADGVRYYGEEKSTDMYPSVDLLVKNMEKQIVRYKEKQYGNKSVPQTRLEKQEITVERSDQILFREVDNKPKDEVEAFLEMNIDKKDFILFRRHKSKNIKDLSFKDNDYAVIYRQGDRFRIVEIPIDRIDDELDRPKIDESDLIVVDNSPDNPKIEFKKKNKNEIKSMDVDNAVKMIKISDDEFLPFYNIEMNFLNIICKRGNNLELIVPSL